MEGWLSVQGSIWALSARQREVIQQASREYRSQALGEGCSNHTVDKSVGESKWSHSITNCLHEREDVRRQNYKKVAVFFVSGFYRTFLGQFLENTFSKI